MSKTQLLDDVALAPKPNWVPDNSVSACGICLTEFSFTFRRVHHTSPSHLTIHHSSYHISHHTHCTTDVTVPHITYHHIIQTARTPQFTWYNCQTSHTQCHTHNVTFFLTHLNSITAEVSFRVAPLQPDFLYPTDFLRVVCIFVRGFLRMCLCVCLCVCVFV